MVGDRIPIASTMSHASSEDINGGRAPPVPRVVGIGASAGGIEALRGFFQHWPVYNGTGVVVVLHLSPDRNSVLAEIIARWTQVPVEPATDGVAVAAGHVYVIPPNSLMTMQDGRLRLRAPTAPMRENMPIDTFFVSLAADRGPLAAAMVLSGTGSDGALELKAIKEAGGVALAQGGMPTAAIATGAVDLILPFETMPEYILRLETRSELQSAEIVSVEAQIAAAQPEICGVLRHLVGHDFSGYKQQTFARRVLRRMQFFGLDLPNYVHRLRTTPNEGVLLFHDLLIGVTSFFRDAETFSTVEQKVIPRLFNGKGADDTVRVWVPGCATGEEAYTLAILLRKYMATISTVPKVQLFATDIDEAALTLARTGRYPALLLKGVSRERAERFFVASDGTYQARKEVRDLCTFSTHSVIRDPPFSSIDLISCRNLLIYLDTELQARVIPAFHYSLVPGGYLLLGGSEIVTRHGELFTAFDKKHHVFQRRDVPSPPLQLSLVPAPGRAMVQPLRRWRAPGAASSGPAQSANDCILERYAPPFVVVDAQGDVLHFSSRTGRYLEPAAGMPSRDVVSMARHGLRLELRAALRAAVDSNRTVERKRINVELPDGTQMITLTVEPLSGHDADRLLMVVFSDIGTMRLRDEDATEAQPKLQSTTEGYETTLEELKSANEELQSVNEELQSTNEELETAKEEIQSTNEELQTVNMQLTAKVDELDHANTDLRNVFESTRVATIFIDRALIIRNFTPAVVGIYNLIQSDKGRPLIDIVSQIECPDLQSDARATLDTGEPIEWRITRRDGSVHYLMRMLPYRTSDDAIDGVLITFVDVTSLVQAEHHHRMLVDELNHRVRNMLTVVFLLATQTLRQSPTLPEFSTNFMGRVNALAAAYTLLSRDNWTDAPLRDVLLEEARPFTAQGRQGMDLAGSPLFLTPRGALAFGMVVHELITNAVKYGALSVPDGKVTMRWDIEPNDGGDRLVWHWVERDGPPVVAPATRGFGLSLIERSLTHELKGKAAVVFEPTGLEATLTMPLDPTIASRTAARGQP
jgi:two-component system CheB/CheR fusion protein